MYKLNLLGRHAVGLTSVILSTVFGYYWAVFTAPLLPKFLIQTSGILAYLADIGLLIVFVGIVISKWRFIIGLSVIVLITYISYLLCSILF